MEPYQFNDTMLGGLLLIDLVLTAYGVYAFKSAHKICHEMLVKLVSKHDGE